MTHIFTYELCFRQRSIDSFREDVMRRCEAYIHLTDLTVHHQIRYLFGIGKVACFWCHKKVILY